MAIEELTIDKLGPKGDGMAWGSRGLVYVDRALPGDRIIAQIEKDENQVPRGQILDLLSASPHRREAPCQYYDRCGNCTLQHLRLRYYRRWKTEVVKEAFQKVGLRPLQWDKPVYLESPSRRRVTFTALKQGGKTVIGYYRRRSSELANIDSCLITDPRLLVLRSQLKPFLVALLTVGKSLDISIQVVNDAVDVLLIGPVGRSGKPDRGVRAAMAQFLEVSQVTRISWRSNDQEMPQELVKSGPVIAKFGVIKVILPPGAFLQPSEAGEKTLVETVLSALPAYGKFADLFSGCGTFSGHLLTHGSVDAFELESPVITVQSRVANKSFRVFRRDLFRNPLRHDEINRYDAVVFNPPRAGCPEQASAMAGASVPLLIGISCNPATFSRDSRILCEGGYRLKSLKIVDQFLWSHHVEIVGVFSKGAISRNQNQREKG